MPWCHEGVPLLGNDVRFNLSPSTTIPSAQAAFKLEKSAENLFLPFRLSFLLGSYTFMATSEAEEPLRTRKDESMLAYQKV